MSNCIENTQHVSRYLIPEDQRLAHVERLFGLHFPLHLEPFVYGITDRITADYHGGYWHFYTLDNGGFYMAPDDDRVFAAQCLNYWQGKLSADALGITACLYAYSNLSFYQNETFGRLMADHYHWLRDYMFEHPEAAAILGAID